MEYSSRIRREARTVETMIRRYCRSRHGSGRSLCPECEELLVYARKRLSLCPFQEGKTTCGKCRVHCYKPAMREKIRKIMRTIGPTMLLTNPIMGIRHAVDGLRREPVKKKRF